MLRKGSSPHVRGTRPIRAVHVPEPGIIPACAGNTSHSAVSLRVRRDHPRMCGEHLGPAAHVGAAPGSSPHVRGTPLTMLAQQGATGIIPACAGNTQTQTGRKVRSGDHPRMCGEH